MRTAQHTLLKLTLVLIVGISAFSCKSSKKMEAARQEKAKREADSLRRVDEARRQEAEAQARREAEELKAKNNAAKEVNTSPKLDQYFDAIANSTSDVSANRSIEEALQLFASPDALVLIVIHEYGTQKDYDKPTNIKNYLNYLKDQKKNLNSISHVKVDETTGKITEVELKKN